MTDTQKSRHSTEPKIVKIEQINDVIPQQTVSTRHATITYLYTRSNESRTHNTEGQDYLTFSHNEYAVSFAVCDGVGQSFCGNLAAKFLGDELVRWLDKTKLGLDESGQAQQLTGLLKELTTPGQEKIQTYPLPEDTPPLVQQALEGQRGYGSETMFVCGRLEFSPDPMDLRKPGRLFLYWLGDTEVQVFDRKDRPINIGAEWTTQERWSTTKGIKGANSVHVWGSRLDEISHIIIYSDGLASVADQLYELVKTPKRLQEQVEELYNAPESDDISLIDIQLKILSSPKLWPIKSSLRRDSYELHWEPMSGIDRYIVEQAGSVDFEKIEKEWVTVEPRHRVARESKGNYFYRVRASDGIRHEPSNVEQVQVLFTTFFLRIALAILITILAALIVWGGWMTYYPGDGSIGG